MAAKIKTNYLAGTYELVRIECDSYNCAIEEETYLTLTAIEAKALIKNKLWERLGFKSIEYIETKRKTLF